jgi:formylglycine-generating enzyme required for sulfatase activity
LGQDREGGAQRGPLENVSWHDAVEFCRRLSDLPVEKRSGRTYRLPTEAEWEYACRGGARTSEPFHFGETLSAEQASVEFTPGRPTGVGSYPANGFGLHDLRGNVLQWCEDWYGASYYKNSPGRDPRGPDAGSSRVNRGGSFGFRPRDCRAANR